MTVINILITATLAGVIIFCFYELHLLRKSLSKEQLAVLNDLKVLSYYTRITGSIGILVFLFLVHSFLLAALFIFIVWIVDLILTLYHMKTKLPKTYVINSMMYNACSILALIAMIFILVKSFS